MNLNDTSYNSQLIDDSDEKNEENLESVLEKNEFNKMMKAELLGSHHKLGFNMPLNESSKQLNFGIKEMSKLQNDEMNKILKSKIERQNFSVKDHFFKEELSTDYNTNFPTYINSPDLKLSFKDEMMNHRSTNFPMGKLEK
jgi:hypothetical protein